jgi:hypothetical protein
LEDCPHTHFNGAATVHGCDNFEQGISTAMIALPGSARSKILTTTRHDALELMIGRMAILAAMAVWYLAARRCSE